MNLLESLNEITPVEEHCLTVDKTMLFKRNDLFAPPDLGGINGNKLMQAIYIVSKLDESVKYIINASSNQSPQHLIIAAVAQYYNKLSMSFFGGLKENALKLEELQKCRFFNMIFFISRSPYKNVLKKRCESLQRETPNSVIIEFGFTPNYDKNKNYLLNKKELTDYMLVTGKQVRNLPNSITTLIITGGSCNTLAQIYTGFVHYGYPKNLKKIIVIGIGGYFFNSNFSHKMHFLNIPTNLLEIEYINLFNNDRNKKYKLKFYESTHDPRIEDNIVFHPTYEAKSIMYIKENRPELITPNTLFWIVGGQTNQSALEKVRKVKYPLEIYNFDK